MSAVCPSCGVAVVAGYVRCPKCGAPLPATRRAATRAPGGTAISSRGRGPLIAGIVGAAAVVALVLVLALGSRDHAPVAAPTDDTVQPGPNARPADPTEEPSDPTGTGAVPSPRPDPSAAVDQLGRALKRERLWGTVSIISERVDVRSGACADPKMAPVLDAARAPLREAGLTKLRCLEQSGAVVFERDL